jgi:Cu/Ag efflux protein CusF
MLKFTPKYSKSIAALVLAGVLALSSLGVAFAASPADDGKPKQGVFGSVTTKSANSFTVRTNQGSTKELAVTGDTQFRAPGKAEASFFSLAVGSRVAILAEGEGGSPRALKVMLFPGEPQREHRVLTVIDASGKTVVAEDAQGNRIEVELEREASADIKGQLVTFIGARSEQSNRFKSNVEVKIGQVVKRLEAQAKKVEAETRGEANAQIKAKKEKELAELNARLEANMQRHLDLFAEIIARAPMQAQPSLKTNLQLTLSGYRAALQTLGDSKANVETRLHLRTLHGSVEAINAQSNEIMVKSRGDATVRLKLIGDTKILIGEKTGNLSNIAVGDQVKVQYNSETSVAAEFRLQTEAEAHGTIQSVDTAQSQLVIALVNGATLTLKLTPNTNIEVSHKKAAAADLKANALVEVEYNIKTMEAREVEASTKAEVRGTVKAIDSASGTVTIHTEDGKEVKVKVANATRVDIHGMLFGVLGITPGMAIKAEFDLTTGEAVELKARTGGPGEGRVRAEGKVHGTVARNDSANGKLTVNLDGGGTLTVRATADTRIEFNGQRVALANLQTEARAKIGYNTETLIASEIEARSRPQVQLEAEVHGTIQALDATKHTMTIRLRDGSIKELVWNADSVIHINRRPSTGADLKPGMEVEARYRTDISAILRINSTAKVETQAEIPGKLKHVNAIAGQLVVETADGKSVVVFLDNTTRITKSGQPLTLLELIEDSQVKIQLKMAESRNVAENVVVLGMSSVSLDVSNPGQASASGDPGTKGEANRGVEVEVKAP